jgi:nucleoside-diphosphate-sugar epimerase
MRILVIGGTVFIGRAAVRRLLADGHEVTVFHRGNHPNGEAVAEVLGDRADSGALRRTLEVLRPDAVLDMIAMVEADAVVARDAARAVGFEGRWLLVSSADVYARFGEVLGVEPAGAGGAEPGITEESPLRTSRHPYRGKGMGERADAYDKIPVEEALIELPGTVVLRLPMVYGPGDPQRRVGRVLDALRTREVPEPMVGWEWTTSVSFVGNTAAAIARLLAVEAPAHRVYHLADEAITERDWAERVALAAGTEPPAVAGPPSEHPPLELRTDRIDAELPGWRETTTEEGIRRTADAGGPSGDRP